MFAAFKAYAAYFHGPIGPAESVQAVMKVVGEAKLETHAGVFIGHKGSKHGLYSYPYDCKGV